MTTDERISKDLAVVSRLARERPIALDATLGKVGARIGSRSEAPPHRAPFTQARVYAHRVAMACAGAMALAAAGAVLVLVRFANALDFASPGVLAELVCGSKLSVATAALFAACVAYIAGTRIALRRFERSNTSVPHTLATTGRWATIATIAGAMALIVIFGMLQVTIGGNGLELYASTFTPELQIRLASWTMVFMISAIAGSCAGAIVVGRVARKPSSRALVLGIALAVGTVFTGVEYDVGPHFVDWPMDMPSLPFRGALTVTGTLGLFLIVSNIVLAARAREDRELAECQIFPVA